MPITECLVLYFLILPMALCISCLFAQSSYPEPRRWSLRKRWLWVLGTIFWPIGIAWNFVIALYDCRQVPANFINWLRGK